VTHCGRTTRRLPAGALIALTILLAIVPLSAEDAKAPNAGKPDRKGAAVIEPGPLNKKDLAAALGRLAANPRLSGYKVAVSVADADTGQMLFGSGDTAPLIPASNMKLVTTAAALSTLGPDWRFHTLVGTLGNDLVIVGGGDPNLSGRFYAGDIAGAFRQWAGVLTRRGVKRIEGDLVFDDSLFESARVHPDWEPADLSTHSAAPVGALMANDSCLDIYVRGAATSGRPAAVRIDPPTQYCPMRGTIQTRSGSKGIYAIDLRGNPRRLALSGSVPPRANPGVLWYPVDDPGLFAATVIRETLETSGLPIAGQVVRRRVWTPQWRMPKEFKAHVIHTSSLAQTLRVANTRSQNLYAESLMKTLGAYAASKDRRWPSEQGTWADGQAAMAQALSRLGIDTRDCMLSDGSGLSRMNRLTSDVLCRLLVAMARGPHRDLWIGSLGVWGSGNGSIRQYGSDAALDGRAFAKTGYLRDTRTLSGYVRTGTGRLLAFSLLVNGLPYLGSAHSAAKAWQTDVLHLLVQQ